MGRPELATALASLAAQDHPLLEVIVVDATGGQHPPLPAIDWPTGHRVRWVSPGRPLLRPAAAQCGIDQAQGDWIGFLDDDDTFDPPHIGELLREANVHPEAVGVYGKARILDATGQPRAVFGLPFNACLQHYGPLFYWQAALFRRSAIRASGCRLDDTMIICEDRDFIAQLAQHGPLIANAQVNFNFRADTGTSGTGQGANADPIRHTRYEHRYRAKWAGPGQFHTARAARLCRLGLLAYQQGDALGAERAFEATLAAYPEDPSALHGLARLALDANDAHRAEALVRRALALSPQADEFRRTLAQALHRLGAAPDPPADSPPTAVAAEAAVAAPPLTPPLAPDAATRAVAARRQTGDLEGAYALARAVRTPATPPSALLTWETAQLAYALGDFATAEQDSVATHALARQEDRPVLQAAALRLFERALDHRHRALAWQSTAALARQVIGQLAERAAASRREARPAAAIHLIASAQAWNDPHSQACALLRWLNATLPLCAWCPTGRPPHAPSSVRRLDPTHGVSPAGGHLIVADLSVAIGCWLARAAFDRVSLWVDQDDPTAVAHRLADIEALADGTSLELCVPTEAFLGRSGLPAAVAPALIDPDAWVAAAPSPRPHEPLCIGRHGLQDARGWHPSDPALYRGLGQAGYQIRLSTDGIAPASFLAGLDIGLYRQHPDHPDPSGRLLLQAMAAGKPVITVPDAVGAHTVIVPSRTGWLASETAALPALLQALAADTAAREHAAIAARAHVLSLTHSAQSYWLRRCGA